MSHIAFDLPTVDSRTARSDARRSLAANAENVSRFFSLAAALKTKQPSVGNLRAERY